MDFAEQYKFQTQKEVQSAYWKETHVTKRKRRYARIYILQFR